jgi:hypothetical protein
MRICWAPLTRTTAPLKEGVYKVATPGGSVSISIRRIQSIQDAFRIQQIKNAFDTSLQSLSAQVAKDPTSCIQIGKNLELFQNLSHADAVYALARIVAGSGIDGSKAASCLGSVYGKEVALNEYWQQHSGIKFPEGKFTYDTMNPAAYSDIRFAEIVAALNDYATGKGNKGLLDEYFVPQVQVKDTTTIVGLSSGLSSDQIVDKLKVATQEYTFYGCQESDSAVDDDGKQDVGLILVSGKSLKQDEILVIRTWWKDDRGVGPTRSRIYQIFVSNESAVVTKALKDNNNSCGHGKVTSVPQMRMRQTLGESP